MSRSVLVIGSVALVGAAVALVVMLGSGGDDDGTAAQTAKPTTGETTTLSPAGPRPTLSSSDPPGALQPVGPGGQPSAQPGGPPPLATGPMAPTVTPRAQPRGSTADPTGVGSGAGPAGSPGAGPGSSYVVGDVRVRDHRAANGAPMDIPPNVHPPGGPAIDSTLTNAIGQKVRMTLFECVKGTSRDGWGERPRVDGQIVIHVKAGELAVATALMQPRDLSEASTASVKQCMEPKIVGMTTPAPDQADLESYSINLSMAIP